MNACGNRLFLKSEPVLFLSQVFRYGERKKKYKTERNHRINQKKNKKVRQLVNICGTQQDIIILMESRCWPLRVPNYRRVLGAHSFLFIFFICFNDFNTNILVCAYSAIPDPDAWLSKSIFHCRNVKTELRCYSFKTTTLPIFFRTF